MRETTPLRARTVAFAALGLALLWSAVAASPGPVPAATSDVRGTAPLVGEFVDRAQLRNPYGHIPAQCHVETSGGTQNACL
ncbi:MAG: hypothetical protein MUF57_09925, partial [Gammaproteobacteria bacterium]|nr:hypothetical protein [Gammaproteobacteria bacterium]